MCALIAVITLAAYWRVLGNDFVFYDDESYILRNLYIRNGLTQEGIAIAFSKGFCANWHPLTWLSHMLDCQVYGLNPMGHHLTNLLLHVANGLLLFVLLRRMTDRLWCSALVAALFAVHPIHVESVAWIAERKDVLSTFFALLTMLAYVAYVRRPGWLLYLRLAVVYTLGIMAKPMLVTLPFLLVLLDSWPLCRMSPEHCHNLRAQLRALRPLLWEKLPLFLLSADACIMTFRVQHLSGATQPLHLLPLEHRIENALVAYVMYLWKMVWPSGLSVFYPHPGSSLALWQFVGAGVLLLVISAYVLRHTRRRPYLAVGWLWYLLTLVPVIGLVQVGAQGMANRYSYIPLIGVFVMVSWRVSEWVSGKHGIPQRCVLAAAVAVVILLSVLTSYHVGHWRNSESLFRYAAGCDHNNMLAYHNLGCALMDSGKVAEGVACYRRAFLIGNTKHQPPSISEYVKLGEVLLYRHRHPRQAIDFLQKAMHIDSSIGPVQLSLGRALQQAGRPDEAITHIVIALRISKGNPICHQSLGEALVADGKTDAAIVHFKEALRQRPDLREARYALAKALCQRAEYTGAWKQVHLCEEYGLTPDSSFLGQLAAKMPEPARAATLSDKLISIFDRLPKSPTVAEQVGWPAIHGQPHPIGEADLCGPRRGSAVGVARSVVGAYPTHALTLEFPDGTSSAPRYLDL